MPALVNMSVGSSFTTMGALGTMAVAALGEMVEEGFWRISREVSMGGRKRRQKYRAGCLPASPGTSGMIHIL